jgi:hypothetical protein
MEKSPAGWAPRDYGILAFSPDEIDYHAHIMMQDGLIEPKSSSPKGVGLKVAAPTFVLTWKGHDFLELARDQERWNRAKAIIAKVGGAPVAVWMKVLTDLVLEGVDTIATGSG